MQMSRHSISPRTWRRGLAAPLALLLAACASTPGAGPSTDPLLAAAQAMVGAGWPAEPEDRVTTAGDIYLGNLDGQVEVLTARLARRDGDGDRVRLASLLYHRFQLTGRLADAELAHRLLADTDPQYGGVAQAIAEARVALGFHDFDRARAALERAEGRGHDAVVDGLSRALDRALGADWGASEDPGAIDSDPVALVISAADRLERGRIDQATALLRQAQDRYLGSSPYLLAWIQAQQGIAFLRHGDLEHARRFFEAAHRRFPEYALAAEHLAETELALGRVDRAADLYRAVARQTGHPEFYHQLGVAERRVGLEADAKRHLERAERDYAVLVEKYPLMFADHAANYYIERGDTDLALGLARLNRDARGDLSARLLLLEAETAAGRFDSACEQATAIVDAGYAPPELATLRQRLAPRCAARRVAATSP